MAPRRARAVVAGLIAHGREAGTPAALDARRSISRLLSDLGYVVQEHSFGFNAGGYRALPAAGGILAAVSLAEIPLLAGPGFPPWAAAAGLLAMALAIGTVSWRLVLGDGAPDRHRQDGNLIGTRHQALVRCWLVAHLDTKAQAQSMAGRLVAVWVAIVAVLGLVGLAALRLGSIQPPPLAAVAGALGVLAAVLLARGRLVGQSPGARDNGSGLLAVLTAAELATDPSIGIIITGAEEFGLAGARALARERPDLFRQASVLNLDTIDDEGTLFVVSHRAGGALAGRVAERLAGLAPLRQRRLPLGIMVDGVPLARVALAGVTVGRLSWYTLRRMHTSGDEAAGYLLSTAEQLGERLASPI